MKNSLFKRMTDKPYLLWSVLFIIVPLLMVIYYAFTDKTGAFTVKNFQALPDYFSTILLSVLYGIAATAICFVVGYPFAYFLSKHTSRAQRTMVLLVMLPMWMNFLIRTYSLMTILGDSGVINNLLTALGLKNLHMINTGGAVILGMVYNFLPFMILKINTALCKMDHSLLEASADLGANPVQTFRRVTLPLSLPGVINGITLVFLPAVSSFFIPKLLGGGQYFLIGNLIENQFITVGEWNFGSAISMIMAIIMMLLMMVVRKVEIRNQGGKEE